MTYIKLILKKLFSILKEEGSTLMQAVVSPILTLFLLAYVWSNVFVQNIPFAIVDKDNTALSRTIIAQLSNCPELDITTFFDSESELEQAIKDRKVYGGVIIPDNFSMDVSMKKSPKAEVLVDGTNMLIGGNALSGAATVLGTLSAGTELKMLQGNGMYPSIAKTAMGTFSYVQRIMYDSQGSYIRNMSYTLIILVIQMTFLTSFFIPLMIKRKKAFAEMKICSKRFIFNLIDIMLRILLYIVVITVSSFIGLCLIKKYFSLPMKGEIWIYCVLMAAFFFNLVGFGLVFGAILKKMDYFVLTYSLWSSPFTLVSGVAYPFYMMPAGLVKIIKAIVPLVQVAVPLKMLNLKGCGWDAVLPYFKESVLYSICWISAGLVLYTISVMYEKYKISKQSCEVKDVQELEVCSIAE